jgi:hypothetical protein
MSKAAGMACKRIRQRTGRRVPAGDRTQGHAAVCTCRPCRKKRAKRHAGQDSA